MFYHRYPLQQKVLLKLYDTGVRLTHTINQVHPYLLGNLRFPSDLCLSSVGLLDQQVSDLRDRFLNAYGKVVIPLKAYAAEYKMHQELFSLEVGKFIE